MRAAGRGSAVLVASAISHLLRLLRQLEAALPHVEVQHLPDQLLEGGLHGPAGRLRQLGHVAEEGVHLRGPEVLGGDLHHHLPRGLVDALLLQALPAPGDRLAAHLEAERHELADRVLLARGDHKVFRRLLLEHQPHRLDVVPRVPPVPQRVEIPQDEPVPAACHDVGHVGGDLLRHKGASAPRRLVVEEDAVAGVHVVGLAVVFDDPEAVELRDRVGRARVEGRGLPLGDLLHQAVELRGGCLVETGCLLEAAGPNGLEDAENADAVSLRGVLGFLEGHLHVRLRGEVVDLVRPDLRHHGHQVRAVDHVAVVQLHLVEDVVNPVGVEGRRAPDDPMYLVLLLQKELCQVGTVLARDARDERSPSHPWKSDVADDNWGA
mmetsp:Transcript_33862/g.106059  ORF Transcript_33862/g.106059 Transcript_33862/m.106059 type:complete len:379 (+) Transcript_33862:154-1290(+)